MTDENQLPEGFFQPTPTWHWDASKVGKTKMSAVDPPACGAVPWRRRGLGQALLLHSFREN